MTVLIIVTIALLLMASGLCSAIETSFTAASAAKIHKLRAKGSKAAEKSLTLIKIKEKVISTVLIICSICNTFATTLATGFCIAILGEENGTIISSVVMAAAIIIFAEVIPKAISVAKPEALVVLTSPIVEWLLKVMQPINLSLSYVVKFFCFIFRINLTQQFSAADEVKGIVEHYHVEGDVQKHDRDMIGSVLDIGKMIVADVMVHRSQIYSINRALPTKQIVQQALTAKHTRIALWQENAENIVGVLDVKKLIIVLNKNNFAFDKIDISSAINAPWFIPETVLVNKQLQSFKTNADQIAFVLDEYGDLRGMVTLKDIVDEIVGHIHDENLSLTQAIVKKGERYFIDGATTIRQINRQLDWNLPEEEANTIAGLIIHSLGFIPKKGYQFEIFKFHLTIENKVGNKIITVIAKRVQEHESNN
jgi:Mg2+/Co2+ transporter CorB